MKNKFSTIITDWYKDNKRELPWRNTTDPYLIWISEIILQQTRVAQGYEYYLRFIDRFPDIPTLAAATEEEVMKHWQGLGYYSRARNLHAAAKEMNGTFPKTYPEVLALKGVGEYTAAAICSFAYHMPYAVVDGNVYRLLSRYTGIDTPIDSGKGKKLFADLAAQLIDPLQPALYNQAIMDFGALQCTPLSPRCPQCPLSQDCIAFATGTVTRLPVKQHQTKTTNRYFYYLYIRAGEYTYIHRRTANDIWKNLFDLPLIETEYPITDQELYTLNQFTDQFAPNETPHIRPLCRNIKHTLSHRIIYASFYEITLPQGTASFAAYQKIPIRELDRYAVSRLIESFLENQAIIYKK